MEGTRQKHKRSLVYPVKIRFLQPDAHLFRRYHHLVHQRLYYGATNMKVLNFGAKKEFVDRYDIQEFLRANHLTDEQIVEDITTLIG